MENHFEYRKYRPGDEAGILSLLQKVFPAWSNKSVDYFLWKYIDSPHGSYVYLAQDRERIISVVCDIALRIKIEDRITLGSYTDDTATDPDYRGRGIYKNVQATSKADRLKNKVYFDYHATENPIIRDHSKATPFPFPLCRMIKIKDVNKYLESTDRNTFINKLGYTLLKSSNTLLERPSAKADDRRDFSISDVREFDDRIDIFWDRVKNSYNFILEKKQDYLNWRYCTYNPDEFAIKIAEKGDDIIGYVVLRYMENSTSSDGSILDLLTLPEGPDVVDSLIEDSLNYFESKGANSVYSQITRGHPLQLHLAKRGFIDVTRASKNLVYYQNVDPDFDPEKFAACDPKTVYFNFY